ncbi:CapA family protein, partial [bacterium]|nr:CapA family protein [bacterium]
MINKKFFSFIFIFLIFSFIFPKDYYFSKVTMIFTGDVMLHDSFLKMYHGKKGFDFNPIFKDIKKDLKGDLLLCNLETTLPGDALKYNGYPMFRSPDDILDALKNAGFTHINFSNNHIYDSFTRGYLNTIK